MPLEPVKAECHAALSARKRGFPKMSHDGHATVTGAKGDYGGDPSQKFTTKYFDELSDWLGEREPIIDLAAGEFCKKRCNPIDDDLSQLLPLVSGSRVRIA